MGHDMVQDQLGLHETISQKKKKKSMKQRNKKIDSGGIK